jgi:two-component system cell cycle sensor histidine kinase/response regulator CckA
MLAPAVLVVDDDESILDLVGHILQATGYRVIKAANAREALDAAAAYQGPIPLLVTDIAMPEVNGLELARRFHLEHPETQVVYITAYAEAFDLRGAEVIPKPFTPDQLLSKVQNVLSADRTRPAA